MNAVARERNNNERQKVERLIGFCVGSRKKEKIMKYFKIFPKMEKVFQIQAKKNQDVNLE